MKRLRWLKLVLVLLALTTVAQAKHPITFEDLMKIQRISDPQVSPDGKWIAYVQTSVDLEADRKATHIWLIATARGEARQLTQGEASDSRPRWSPDGQSLAFVSTRGGKSQVWILLLNGGEARHLTSISTEADGVVWAVKSDNLLFTSAVYPDCADDECNRQRLEDYAAKPRASGVLVLDVDEWPANTRLYKALDQSGLQIDCRPPQKKGKSKDIDEAFPAADIDAAAPHIDEYVVAVGAGCGPGNGWPRRSFPAAPGSAAGSTWR